MIEVAIKLSDDDTSLTCKYLLHAEGLCLSHDDAEMKSMVKDSESKFKGSPKDYLIKIKYVW